MSQSARRSAANALKHGYAAIYHVKKEDEPQLQAIRQTLYETYKPSGHREIDLVNRLSVATLKRNRIEEDMQVRVERETRNAPLYHNRQCEADLRKLLAMLRRSPINASDMLFSTYFGARHVHNLWCTMMEFLTEGTTYKAGLKLITELIRISGSHTDIESISGTGRQILLCHLKLSGQAGSEIREYISRGMPKVRILPVYHHQLMSQYEEEAERMTDALEELGSLVESCVESWGKRVEELAPIHELDLQEFIATEAGRGLGDDQLIKQFQLQERYLSRAVNEIRRIETELFRRQIRREIVPESGVSDSVPDFFSDHEARETGGELVRIKPEVIVKEPAADVLPFHDKAAATEIVVDAVVTKSPEAPPASVGKVERISCSVTDDSGLLRLRKRYRLDKRRANELLALIGAGQDPFMNFYDTAMVYVAMPLDTDAFADMPESDRRTFETSISNALSEMMVELQNKLENYMAKEDKGYEELYLMAQWGLLSVEEYEAEVAKLDRLTM